MPKDRPEGLLERICHSLEMCETYLGLISRGNGAPVVSTPSAKTKEVKAPVASTSSVTIPTVADVQTALRELSEKKGRDVAIKYLTDFGHLKASLIPEEKRAEFIAICQA